MAWTVDTAYSNGLTFMTEVVGRVDPERWANPSPCDGWRAIDVLGHMGQGVRFGTALLAGESPRFESIEPPGSAVEGDPATWWRAMVEPARDSVTGVDLDRVVDSPGGPRPIRQGLAFPAVDLFVHAWDIGRGAGVIVTIPDEAIDFAHLVLDRVPDAGLRSPKVFGPELTVGPEATASDTFLAWTGRDPAWVAG